MEDVNSYKFHKIWANKKSNDSTVIGISIRSQWSSKVQYNRKISFTVMNGIWQVDYISVADSANVVGKSGAIEILANVIHNNCLDTEDKIKVTITLGHAMENSGLYLLHMLPFLLVISIIIIHFWCIKNIYYFKKERKTIFITWYC